MKQKTRRVEAEAEQNIPLNEPQSAEFFTVQCDTRTLSGYRGKDYNRKGARLRHWVPKKTGIPPWHCIEFVNFLYICFAFYDAFLVG